MPGLSQAKPMGGMGKGGKGSACVVPREFAWMIGLVAFRWKVGWLLGHFLAKGVPFKVMASRIAQGVLPIGELFIHLVVGMDEAG